MITCTLLGTNGWYSSETGYTLSILIETVDYTIILDAGEGLHKIADIRGEIYTPAWLFLSHLHIDHISGLHTLARLQCHQGLTICVPQGTKKLVEAFIDKPYTIPLTELPYSITIQEIVPQEIKVFPFPVTAGWLFHSQPVLGYRFDLGKIITFATDTGPCDMIESLAQDADLCFIECSNLPEEEGAFHLTPKEASDYTHTARVKQVVLVHFSANLYTTKSMREELVHSSIQDPTIIIGQDDMIITL
jgi:ribonuclease BN (tRNA processing enzyme)